MLRGFYRAVPVLLLVVPLLASACKGPTDSQTLRPRQLRDVLQVLEIYDNFRCTTRERLTCVKISDNDESWPADRPVMRTER